MTRLLSGLMAVTFIFTLGVGEAYAGKADDKRAKIDGVAKGLLEGTRGTSLQHQGPLRA